MISIEVKLTTGVILIYGSSYGDWIKNFFERWRLWAVDGVLDPVESKLMQQQTSQDVLVTNPDIQSDIERLWKEQNSLKNALTTLDSTVNNLSSEIENMVVAINDLKSSQEEVSTRNLTKNDEKLKFFLQTASDDCI